MKSPYTPNTQEGFGSFIATQVSDDHWASQRTVTRMLNLEVLGPENEKVSLYLPLVFCRGIKSLNIVSATMISIVEQSPQR